MVPESPCSSDIADDKADWKADSKKWRGHTSSSSRDLSPWDDDEYRSRRGIENRSLSSHPDRHGFYMRHARRMNSCDDDYEYEDEKARRRERRSNNSTYIVDTNCHSKVHSDNSVFVFFLPKKVHKIGIIQTVIVHGHQKMIRIVIMADRLIGVHTNEALMDHRMKNVT